MRSLFRNLTLCIVLLTAPMALADRQGGGGLLVSTGRVSIDKWLDFEARLVPVVVPDLNLANVNAKPVSEFVRFKSAQGDQVTFDYTWIHGAQASSGQVTLNRAQISKENLEIVNALLKSKVSSTWTQLP
jgi:hypothetical protein